MKKLSDHEKLSLLASILALLASIAMILASGCTDALGWEAVLYNFLLIFVGEIFVTIFILVCIAAGHYVAKHESFGIFETKLVLLLEKWKQHMAMKNSEYIAPALKIFLYNVLCRNREILHVSVGSDDSCLSPNGQQTIIRNGSIYYKFELILDKPPELEISVLYMLLNQFILSEMNNYGIDRLPSTYHTPCGPYPSVYLDRLIYDDMRRRLVFEILFVGSEASRLALERACQRDYRQDRPAEPDVYDDDI